MVAYQRPESKTTLFNILIVEVLLAVTTYRIYPTLHNNEQNNVRILKKQKQPHYTLILFLFQFCY